MRLKCDMCNFKTVSSEKQKAHKLIHNNDISTNDKIKNKKGGNEGRRQIIGKKNTWMIMQCGKTFR